MTSPPAAPGADGPFCGRALLRADDKGISGIASPAPAPAPARCVGGSPESGSVSAATGVDRVLLFGGRPRGRFGVESSSGSSSASPSFGLDGVFFFFGGRPTGRFGVESSSDLSSALPSRGFTGVFFFFGGRPNGRFVDGGAWSGSSGAAPSAADIDGGCGCGGGVTTAGLCAASAWLRDKGVFLGRPTGRFRGEACRGEAIPVPASASPPSPRLVAERADGLHGNGGVALAVGMAAVTVAAGHICGGGQGGCPESAALAAANAVLWRPRLRVGAGVDEVVGCLAAAGGRTAAAASISISGAGVCCACAGELDDGWPRWRLGE